MADDTTCINSKVRQSAHVSIIQSISKQRAWLRGQQLNIVISTGLHICDIFRTTQLNRNKYSELGETQMDAWVVI
jgi:hypothetical protein